MKAKTEPLEKKWGFSFHDTSVNFFSSEVTTSTGQHLMNIRCCPVLVYIYICIFICNDNMSPLNSDILSPYLH